MVDPKGVEDQLLRDYGAVPIFLSRQHLKRYYFGFSNKVLWPILHYLPTHIDYDERDFLMYREVNEIFAEKIIEFMGEIRPDDMIWIQDYQLMLVPALVRKKFPDARIGFFLHTPFPSSEVFRAMPYREELLHGLLGASLIGFHTFSYLRHFRSSLLHILGIDSEINKVELETHQARMGAFPISIDVDRIQETMQEPDIDQDLQVVRNITHGRKMILSVDRLDYTKGLPDRLRAYKKFLMRNPQLVRDVVLVQIAVPSRTQIKDYQELKEAVEVSVMDIVETYENEPHAPIHFIYRSLPFKRLCAFYMEADVALVTPYFDGMNLVAKEFVAVKKDDGVLILSEHAGAAHELGEALITNPWNPDRIARALEEALSMNESERSRRMSAMFAKVSRNNVHYWSNSFLSELAEMDVYGTDHQSTTTSIGIELAQKIRGEFSAAKRRLLLLDYDGTLTEIRSLPSEARPDPELVELLKDLTALENTDVFIITGRKQRDIKDWLGDLPLGFSVEHGLHIKFPDESEWHKMLPESGMAWYENVRDLFEHYNRTTPGSFTEEKEASIAWHYRMSDPTQGRWKARELTINLQDVLANQPLEVLSGKMVVEVRFQGLHKGNILNRARDLDRSYDFILAVGDDETDEYLFNALPVHAYSVKVGKAPTHAAYRLASVRKVREFLKGFLAKP